MSDVQKKDVLQQNDANPIPIGQYTISKMLGITTVDISQEDNSETVYSALFEELKGKELDAYQEKYRFYQKKYQFDNEKYFFIDRFCKLLAEPQKYEILIENITDKNIYGLSKFIEDKCNEVVNDAAAKVANVYEQCKKEIEQLEEEIEEEIKEFEEKMEQLKKGIHGLVRSWLVTKKRPSTEKDRLALYKISFAFNLSMEDHIKLFTHVFKLKPYLRTPAEFCLTYAKEHNMEYSEAVNLYYKYLKERDGNHIKESDDHHDSKTKGSEKYSGTKTLLKEVLDNESDNDHEKFICKLLSVSGTLNVTRKTIEQKIFDIAIAENGKKTVIFCDDDLMIYGLDSLKALMSKFYKGMYDTGNREAKSKNSKENKSEKNKNKESQRKPNPQAEFLISIESAFKDKDNKRPVGSKAILQLRKIYIICRTYQMWNSFDKEDEYKNIFTGFYNTLSRDLIKINLPQLDYLDDFDRGIILATAYRLHKNSKETLVDLINKIVPSE